MPPLVYYIRPHLSHKIVFVLLNFVNVKNMHESSFEMGCEVFEIPLNPRDQSEAYDMS